MPSIVDPPTDGNPPSPDGDPVADAIREWSQPDPGLGWIGSREVFDHALEIADFLFERGLTS